jgi:hypothetical protein
MSKTVTNDWNLVVHIGFWCMLIQFIGWQQIPQTVPQKDDAVEVNMSKLYSYVYVSSQ